MVAKQSLPFMEFAVKNRKKNVEIDECDYRGTTKERAERNKLSSEGVVENQLFDFYLILINHDSTVIDRLLLQFWLKIIFTSCSFFCVSISWTAMGRHRHRCWASGKIDSSRPSGSIPSAAPEACWASAGLAQEVFQLIVHAAASICYLFGDSKWKKLSPADISTHFCTHFPSAGWSRMCPRQADSMRSPSQSSAAVWWFGRRPAGWSRRAPSGCHGRGSRRGRCPWSGSWTRDKDRDSRTQLRGGQDRGSSSVLRTASRLECTASWMWSCRYGCIGERTAIKELNEAWAMERWFKDCSRWFNQPRH